MKALLLALLRIYAKYVSPRKRRSCRFYPTCSQYAQEALQRHGLKKGVWMTVRRLARCHPFHPGGYDPVE